MLLRNLLAWAAPAGPRSRLSVLMFHRVVPEVDPLFPDEMHAARFDELCGRLARWFHVLPLDEAARRLADGSLPSRPLSITFDDGYADNREVALPILQKHGLTATFFISTGFLDGGRMWNDSLIETVRACRLAELDLSSLDLGRHPLASIEDRRAAVRSLVGQVKYQPVARRLELCGQIAQLAQVELPTDLMMSSEQVVELRRAGMQIGAHTLSHPILAKLDEPAAEAEILGSKQRLEELLGERVGLFAYPNGKPGEDYSPANVELTRRLGFDAAVSTAWGASRQGDDLMQIYRFTPWDRSLSRFGWRMLANLRRA
ncbi:polysaccharide deacetylase family protein [Pelomonas sp. SE-A7]|uniref:polysaccharide deacetylase family protein n=1 Tax=Pelomonas sp. SE-A7 TaxID=3054953 RepID=UPI00259CF861|nr:polysaccharide deacetylase family protein [Pelomonas sp. SE-A7]MDM4764884.1 polysaccharide deacetylase family protein [Pelomonas sp. SE-A7]